MRRLLRDVSFPFQNEQVHSADPHFAEATPWPSAPFYVFLNVFLIKFGMKLYVAVLTEQELFTSWLLGTVTVGDSTAKINRTKK